MLTIALATLFVGVAVTAGFVTARVLAWSTPQSRHLRAVVSARTAGAHDAVGLTDTPDPLLRRLSRTLPKSATEVRRLRRRLGAAGYYGAPAAVYFSAAKVGGLLLGATLPLLALGLSDGGLLAGLGAVTGYLVPDLVLARLTRARATALENGLPDVLDLLIVCMEAGSSIDQSIVKVSTELEGAHPALSQELRFITTEIRAGVPRTEAFSNLARRTRVEDLRSLVRMLQQTDRFGTSIIQAFRVHAQACRSKRRQRAEERAAKIGVKLVFPLVLCIFPAVYVICIGSVVVTIYNTLLR